MIILDRILENARKIPEEPAVADREGVWSYKELIRQAFLVSKYLSSTGLEIGDRVGVQIPPGRPFAGAFLGIQHAGGIPVPLNWMIQTEKINHIEQDSGMVRTLSIGALEDRNKALEKPVDLYSDLLKNAGDLPGSESALEHFSSSQASSNEELGVLLYTSGTTSLPKGTMLTHQNLLSNIEGCERAISIEQNDRFLTSLPLFHTFALTCGLLLPLSVGARTKLVAGFSPKEMLRDLIEQNVTLFLAIPSQYRPLVRQAENVSEEEMDLNSLRERSVRFLSGGEPLPAGVREQVKDVMGSEILEGYGLTETSPVIAVNRPGDNKPGSVGRPLHNVDVRIANPDKPETSLSRGEEGEIQVKGPSIMKGYLNLDDNNEDVFTPNGWFRTGDMGKIDEDGYLSVTGRLKEIIITAGENVAPAEIEEVIMRMEEVVAAAVLGKKDERHGEVPIAFVVPEENAELTPAKIQEFSREHLANHKVPREVTISHNLPVGPTGKIAKRKLKENE